MRQILPECCTRRQLCRIAFALSLAAVAGCASSAPSSEHRRGSDGPDIQWIVQSRAIRGLSQRAVGRGTRAAVLLWRSGTRPPRSTVIFLHGWEALPPYFYGAWLRHLSMQGNTVVYPVMQGLATKAEALRSNALAGIAAGLSAVHADPRTVVVIGHTTGGALAFDYAALARARGLPSPRAVLAIFPGRNPPIGEITPANLSRIPAAARLEVIAGPGDPIPNGEAQARTLLSGATRVPAERRHLLAAPDVGRGGPMRPTRAARRAFWAPADRLIAEARSGRYHRP